MAVGHVASASSGSQASVSSFNIGTLGTGARAGIVFVCVHNSSTDIITGVTWNGTAMTRLYYAADTNTEPGFTVAYFLDNVTNGLVTVSRTNNATVTVGYAASLSAGTGRFLEVAQVKTVGGDGTVQTNANASASGTAASGTQALDDGSPGTNSLRYAAAYTGASTPLGADATTSTALQSLDSSLYGSSFVRETNAGQGSRSVGFATGTTDDYAAVFVVVREGIAVVPGSFTADANIFGTVTPTGLTANAVIKANSGTKTLCTADAVIKRPVPTVATTVDAVIKKTSSQADTQQQTSAGNAISFGKTTGNERIAQSFVPSLSGTLSSVSVYASAVGGMVDSFVCELWTDSGGSPGSLVGSIGSTPSGIYNYSNKSLLTYSCSLSVTGGVTYWIVIRRSGSLNDSSYFYTWFDANTYASGSAAQYVSGSWTTLPTSDLYFVATTYGAPSVTADALIRKTISGASQTFTADAVIQKPDVTPSPLSANAVIFKADQTHTFLIGDNDPTWNGGAWISGGVVTYTFTDKKADAVIFKAWAGGVADGMVFAADAVIKDTLVYTTGGGGTVAQDSFTEVGTGTADLFNNHTAETGGTWSAPILGTSQKALIDKDNDRVKSAAITGNNYHRLGSGTLGDGDLYATWIPYGGDPVGNWGGVAARISGDTFYSFSVRDDVVDGSGVGWQLLRVTAGSVTNVASGSGSSLNGANIHIRLQVSGSSPTALRARYWDASGAEPGTWTVDTTENTSANQMASGGYGLGTCYSTSAYGGSILDDYLVSSSGAAADGPPLYADATIAITYSFTNKTADAVLKRNSGERTFAAEAVIKKTITGSFLIGDAVDPGGAWIVLSQVTRESSWPTDAAIFRNSGEQTFTARAIVFHPDQPAGTLSADAVLFKEMGGSGTADSVLFRSSGTKTTTADAVIQRDSGEKTATADSVLFRGSGEKTNVADAVLKRVVAPTPKTADAVLQKSFGEKTATADAVLQRSSGEKTITADAIALYQHGLPGDLHDFSAAAWMQRTVTETPKADAVLGKTLEGSFTSRAVVFHPGEPGAVFGVDAAIFRAGIAGTPLTSDAVIHKPDVAATPETLDATILKTQSGGLTGEAVIRVEQSQMVLGDAIARREQSGTFTADAATYGTLENHLHAEAWFCYPTREYSFAADAAVWTTLEDHFHVEAWVLGAGVFGTSLDAVIYGTQDKTAKADAVVRRSAEGSASLDSAVLRTSQTALTANAIVLRDIPGAFAADSVIYGAGGGGGTLDAILRAPQARTTTGDGVVRREQSATSALDAVVLTTSSGSFSADVISLRTQEGTLTAEAWLYQLSGGGAATVDAVLLGEEAGSFTAGAWVLGEGVYGWATDAVVKATGNSALTADGVIRRGSAAALTTDAIVQASVTSSYSAMAGVRATRTGDASADAVFRWVGQQGSYTTQSIIRREATSSVHSDASIFASLERAYTANAIIAVPSAEKYGYLDADAVVLAPASATLAASATVRSTIASAFVARAVIEKTATSSSTAEALLLVTRTDGYAVEAVVALYGALTFPADACIFGASALSFGANAVITILRPFRIVASVTAHAIDCDIRAATHGATVTAQTIEATVFVSEDMDVLRWVNRTRSLTAEATIA